MTFRTAFFAVVSVLACGVAHAQQDLDVSRFLVTGKEGILAASDMAVATDGVRSAEWSADGRALLLVRKSVTVTQRSIANAAAGKAMALPVGEVSLMVYALGYERPRTVWRAPLGQGDVGPTGWLPGGATALAVVRNDSPGGPRFRLLLIDGATASARTLLEPETHEDPALVVSPARPYALVMAMATAPIGGNASNQALSERYWIVSGVQRFCKALDLPDGAFFNDWSADGATATFVSSYRNADGVRTKRWLAVDAATGRVSSPTSTQPARQRQVETPALLRVDADKGTVQAGGVTRAVHSLWLVTSAPSTRARLLLCADGVSGSVSPDQRYVAYLSQGTAFVARLVHADAGLLEAAENQALRTTGLSNAKQVGLAILMYAQDYNGVLPGPGDLSQSLVPYLHTAEPLAGFVYTYGGGSISDLNGQTVIGYMPVPGGRAVLYGDGHVVIR